MTLSRTVGGAALALRTSLTRPCARSGGLLREKLAPCGDGSVLRNGAPARQSKRLPVGLRRPAAFRAPKVAIREKQHLGAQDDDLTSDDWVTAMKHQTCTLDTDSVRLRELGDRLDIRTVQGKGSFPTILRQAGADDADMLIAVTNSDEINMVACQVAYSLHHHRVLYRRAPYSGKQTPCTLEKR